MANELKIPSVGESITSATIAEWHKADGEYVNAGDEVLTIDTDKVSQSLEVEVAGILRHRAAEGDEVDIGAVVAVIEEGEAPPKPRESEAKSTPPALPPEAAPTDSEEAKATSLAMKMAQDKGIDLASIKGTGTGGRITKSDILAVSEAGAEKPAQVPTPPRREPGEKKVTRRKMSPLRRKIADHLVNAQHEAAILSTFNECDMSAVMEIRKRVQEKFVARNGVKLGFMSFFLKAVVEGLQAVPSINGRVEGEEIVENHFYDIGVAVGTDKGLVVPVIRDVDQSTLR